MRPVTGLILVIVIFIFFLPGCSGEDASSPVKSDRAPQLTQLTDNPDIFEANPIYSPDGNWILFESDAGGIRNLWLIPASGGEARQLTTGSSFDTAPFWSPDGGQIVFESDRSGFKNIWILDVEHPEVEPVALTSGSWNDGDPVWPPMVPPLSMNRTGPRPGAPICGCHLRLADRRCG